MRYFTHKESIPAAAVTYSGMGAIQPILFTTQRGYTDSSDAAGLQGRELVWSIRSVKVTIVRDWNTSVAQIVLTTELPQANQKVPSLPDISSYRGGNYPYLTYEDEIRIYAGWIDSPSTPICAEMLDQYPLDLCPKDLEEQGRCGPAGEYSFKADMSKPLVPIFWGFIDTINVVADKGIQCVLQCRDRSRIFSDTKIISIPELQGSNALASDEGGLATGDRSGMLLSIARSATGTFIEDVNQGSRTRWKQVLGSEEEGTKVFTGYEGDPNIELNKLEPPEDPAGWIRAAVFKPMDIEGRPRFHRWVQRPPYKKGNGAAVFQILNRSPMEVVQFLANTEERPTDFYASHVNGDFVFAPHVLDTSGFYDENRMYRTYFFKSYPLCMADNPPPVNQMIISMRSASSSLGTYNRYIIVDSETSGGYGDFIENIQMAMEIDNWNVVGRKVMPPSRNFIIYDGSLGSYDGGNKAGAALLTGITAGRTTSREMAAMSMTVVGDPTLYPNEAVRVYNSVLHDFATSINPGTPESIQALEEQQVKWEQLSQLSFKEEFMNHKDEFLSFENNTIAQEEISKIDNYRAYTGPTILPVYKIRSVQHNITTGGNDIGFTTKVEMITDY